jgi:hypothetical protein
MGEKARAQIAASDKGLREKILKLLFTLCCAALTAFHLRQQRVLV